MYLLPIDWFILAGMLLVLIIFCHLSYKYGRKTLSVCGLIGGILSLFILAFNFNSMREEQYLASQPKTVAEAITEARTEEMIKDFESKYGGTEGT